MRETEMSARTKTTSNSRKSFFALIDPQVSNVVIGAFRKRWAQIRKWARPHTLDRIKGVFEAASEEDQAKLAHSFYGKKHSDAMCALSDERIVRNLLALCRQLGTLPKPELAATAKDSLAYPYILFECDPFVFDNAACKPIDQINLETDEPSIWEVAGYPARVLYDDWYERVGGLNDDYLGVLMKATGERFSIREQQMLIESVIGNIVWDEDETWEIKVTPAAKKNQMVVSIHRTRKAYHKRAMPQKKSANGKRIRRLPRI
jgi:hypothetical protein